MFYLVIALHLGNTTLKSTESTINNTTLQVSTGSKSNNTLVNENIVVSALSLIIVLDIVIFTVS